jgi:hypothetical protein
MAIPEGIPRKTGQACRGRYTSLRDLGQRSSCCAIYCAASCYAIRNEWEPGWMFASCSQRIQAYSQIMQAGGGGYSHGIRAGTVACLQAHAVTFASGYTYWQSYPGAGRGPSPHGRFPLARSTKSWRHRTAQPAEKSPDYTASRSD